MQDISELSLAAKEEIAEYIKRDNLEHVNAHVTPVHVKDTFYTRYGKRMLDFLVGLIGFVVFLPANIIIGIVTFFDVGRPILFKQQRVGKDTKRFTIYKFRNMTNDVDANGELLPPYERVTKWGKFVRKTSLDELLNFVSVLKGDMSIIGPRPILDYYEPRLNDRHRAIYAVRPGLECPTPHRVDHALSWQERLDNYVWYTENCSFLLDVKLIFRMFAMVFDRKSTAQRSKAKSSYGVMMGYYPDGNMIYSKSVPDQYVEEFCRNHGYADLDEAVASRNVEGQAMTSTDNIKAEREIAMQS